MRDTQPRAGAAVLGVAGFGLALGHWLTYVLQVPDTHQRANVLAQSGHGYLPVATQFAVVAGIAAFAVVFLGRLMRRDRPMAAGSTFAWMACFQVCAFIAMEVLERAASGASLAHLLHGSLVPVGVVVQLVVAVAGTTILRLLLRAADRIAVLLDAAPRPRPTLGWRLPDDPVLVAAAGARGPAHIRGPPSLLPR